MGSSKQVSTMIKQGFISDPSISPSISPKPLQKISPLSSPSRPTLFQMMSDEHLRDSKQSIHNTHKKLHDKLSKVLCKSSNLYYYNNNNCYNYEFGDGDGDVNLTVSGRDGFKISMDVHRKVLAEKSKFFAEKLRGFDNGDVNGDGGVVTHHSVEICDCDDVEIYVEALVLMYSDDLKIKLLGENVTKVLGLLKVSAAIMFEDGILSCLEYLEAVPWSEEEEEKIISCLSQLNLHNLVSDDVLQRVSIEASTSTRADDMFMQMLTGVLQAKDDKARREMKSLISRLLREDAADYSTYGPKIDVSRDALYSLCHRCLSALILCLSKATCAHESRQDRGAIMTEIAREADNMQWIVEILIDKKMGDEFVKLWADQKELASLHSRIPTMYRHEISRVTAQLCIAIGRGHILVPKETRYCLLSTWLEPLFEDFGWMKRASRSVDKKLVEDGLSQTILTLPMLQQQSILMNWFDRFLNKGDDCPNIQKAFEIWWRRAFIRQYTPEPDQHMQITVCDYAD